MGPSCPECETVFPWTPGELEEVAFGPRVYVCASCGMVFVLEPEEVAALQVRLRSPEPEPAPAPVEVLETTPIVDLEPEDAQGEVAGTAGAARRSLDLGVRLSEIGQRLYEKLARMSGASVSDDEYARLFDIEQRTWRDAVTKGTQSIAHLSLEEDGPETERLRAQARALLDRARAHLRPVR